MKKHSFKRGWGLGVCTALLVGILTACGGASQNPGSNTISEQTTSTGASPQQQNTSLSPTKVTQVMNWFAEPEEGGQYEALIKGYYKEAGLDMTVQQGGPQVSVTQIVAGGRAEFGMAEADQVLQAIDNGIPIVALFAVFQTNPQILMFHSDHPVQQWTDLNGRPVAVAPGVVYWTYLQKKYGLNVKEQAYNGTLANFLSDPAAVTQGYVTSEPYYAKQQNVKVGYKLIADSGYNPYANVLFTTKKYLAEHPQQVKAFVEASIKGWNSYLEQPDDTNAYMKTQNKDLDMNAMKYGWQAEKPLIMGGDASSGGVGTMTEARWQELYNQLKDLGLLKTSFDFHQAYTTEFLPQK
ncbi:MAG: ABC transporter substrate-binding protein [Firmicutes bacterium]|nr:ABC transporter substrate-binding protein [Bacillota bacterium]